MSFLTGLLQGRSHLAFLLGLAISLITAWQVDKATLPGAITQTASASSLPRDLQPKLRSAETALSAEERAWAQTAWRYFENNTQVTGLVNSVNDYSSTTLWDQGSYLLALLCAKDLGLVDDTELVQRLDKALGALERLPLVEGTLPNKAYDTVTLKMVDYNNHQVAEGLVWSAIDLARLAVPLTVIVWRYPDCTARVHALLSRWKLGDAAHEGEPQGATRRDGRLDRVQEGRYGYEEYAARSLFLLGLDMGTALTREGHAHVVEVSGIKLLADTRAPEKYDGTQNALVSEPFLLDAFEFGPGSSLLPQLQAMHRVQAAHAHEMHRLVAVSEDNLDKAPFFAYNSVLNGDKEWAAFAPDGSDAAAAKTLSLKAAVGWGVLFDDAYADELLAGVGSLRDAKRGWFSGRYDVDGRPNTALTANTNGIVLEAMRYRVLGAMLPSVHGH